MSTAQKVKKGKVVASLEEGAFEEAQVVGWLSFYTVPDKGTSVAKAKKVWKDKNLDPDLAPGERIPKDVFQAACRSVESRRVNGKKDTEIKVDEIMETREEVAYQVTRLIRDKDNRLIEHPKAMRVTFNKGESTIQVEPLEPEHYAALQGLEERIRKHFDDNAKRLTGAKMRHTLREVLRRVKAENLRGKSGGIYFIPKDAKPTLEKVRGFLAEVYGADAEMNLIPLANDDTQREMVRRHFTANTMERVDDMIGRIAHRLRTESKDGRSIRSDMVANIVSERKALGEARESYAALLEDELDEVQMKMKLLDTQIVKLMDLASDDA